MVRSEGEQQFSFEIFRNGQSIKNKTTGRTLKIN